MSPEPEGFPWIALAVSLAVFAIGFTGCFLASRRHFGVWRAGIWSFLGGVSFLWIVDGGLESVTRGDLWGPPPRSRTARERIPGVADAHVEDAVVPIDDWDGDGVPEFVRSQCLVNTHFHSHTSYQRIDVVSGRSERVLGSVEFSLPMLAVPRACGDLDGDGFEEFAVDYLDETLVWGREAFL